MVVDRRKLFVERSLRKALANEEFRGRTAGGRAAASPAAGAGCVGRDVLVVLALRRDFQELESPSRETKRLTLYSLISPIPRRPRLPVRGGNLEPQPLPFRAPLKEIREYAGQRLHRRRADHRRPRRPRHPLRHRDPGGRFQGEALDLFDEKAKLLADRLLAMRPFDEVAHLINVHTVRTVSTDSGISRFPTLAVKKKTYYDVTGHFDLPGLPLVKSFLGTDSPETILAASERVAPLETLELFIVLANVKKFAASTSPPTIRSSSPACTRPT